MCGGQETAKELNSGMEIVMGGWFSKRDDSILNVCCCELLRA